MSSLLDIIYSMLFGGTLFIIVLNANDIAAENQSTYHGDMMVQQMLTSTAQLIEGEFRNMGFGMPEKSATVRAADSSSISFLTDLGRDGGFIDTIRYSIGPVSELAATQNELDRNLYRSVNGGQRAIVGIVTTFRLQYFTMDGELLSVPVPSDRLSEVQVVEVTMEVQNSNALARSSVQVKEGERSALYSSSLWQQTRLASQNSRR
jgi:hypothetical protein